ncbi:MAG: nucleotidyl transferase AbiEii/AbiGii toxin family protein [Actinomycetota bacterium]|nr:nucleotidyl transferase AbiEii/AbiGii toxin family protein [Actinomycetota bacterium]
MITQRELAVLRGEWMLDQGVIEKDYVLGWLLAGIASHAGLAQTWVFKGGTCLRECYYETFLFSEDLDFTIVDGGPEEPEALMDIFAQVTEWVREESGIELVLDSKSFQRKRNRRGQPTTQGRLAYRGPNNNPTMPKVKLDLTSDELLADRPVFRRIGHPYSDQLPVDGLLCYSIPELFGEKLRALAERCRPRDLYDVVHMHRHPDLIGQARGVHAVLEQKCSHAAIDIPTAESVRSSPFRAEIESEWEHMLGHQLPKPLAPFETFWSSLDDVFLWLAGRFQVRELPRAQLGQLDPRWEAPRAISSWRRQIPLELLRYAGANRLKVEVDYHAENGRQGPRLVEPYSIRRTRAGKLVLFVVNDYGQLRSYRIDKIVAIRPTTVPFQPRYRVEF